nr:hypothetical protein [uncultured Lichenicoccus sp.]
MSGSVARPRAQILIAGTVQPGLVSCEINSNNFGRGDTFSAQIAPPPGATWFDPAATAPLDAQIQIGFLPPGAAEGAVSSLPLMIQGAIDTTRWDPIRRTLSVEGRDYSSKLVDYRATVDAFLNNTSSEVVQKLVTAANGTNTVQLTASVTATSTPIGQYFQIEHKRAGAISHSRETTAWDLMTRLARIESYDLYVTGTTVYFQPQLSDTTTPVQLPIGLSGPVPTAPVMTINLERLAGLTKGIQVEVHSWDSRQRKAYVGLWPPKQSNNPDTQKYAFMRAAPAAGRLRQDGQGALRRDPRAPAHRHLRDARRHHADAAAARAADRHQHVVGRHLPGRQRRPALRPGRLHPERHPAQSRRRGGRYRRDAARCLTS